VTRCVTPARLCWQRAVTGVNRRGSFGNAVGGCSVGLAGPGSGVSEVLSAGQVDRAGFFSRPEMPSRPASAWVRVDAHPFTVGAFDAVIGGPTVSAPCRDPISSRIAESGGRRAMRGTAIAQRTGARCQPGLRAPARGRGPLTRTRTYARSREAPRRSPPPTQRSYVRRAGTRGLPRSRRNPRRRRRAGGTPVQMTTRGA
jgi:hypothetical protein